MDPGSLRAFARRDWQAVESLRSRDRARLFRAEGYGRLLSLAWALHEHARALRPEYPSAGERSADLEHHVELKRRIDAAATVFAVR